VTGTGADFLNEVLVSADVYYTQGHGTYGSHRQPTESQNKPDPISSAEQLSLAESESSSADVSFTSAAEEGSLYVEKMMSKEEHSEEEEPPSEDRQVYLFIFNQKQRKELKKRASRREHKETEEITPEVSVASRQDSLMMERIDNANEHALDRHGNIERDREITRGNKPGTDFASRYSVPAESVGDLLYSSKRPFKHHLISGRDIRYELSGLHSRSQKH